jgi:hypothetical protein
MAEVFADTSGWATFLIGTEPFHAVAESLLTCSKVVEPTSTVVSVAKVTKPSLALFLQLSAVDVFAGAGFVRA